MTIYNTGTIKLNKPLSVAAINALDNKDDGALLDYEVNEGDSEIVYEEYIATMFEDIVSGVVEVLAPLGYILNGTIEYYGDYDGRIYIKDNEVTTVDIEEVELHEASDETLIRMLEERGYTVIKNKEENK